jgi:2-methylcitrate synthase
MTKQGGLAGIVAGKSSVCTVGIEGVGLHYRGFDVTDLAENCRFEEVAHLLIHGHLPTEKELELYCNLLINSRTLDANLKLMLEKIPGSTHPMDVLKTATAFLGCGANEAKTSADKKHIADTLIAQFPAILAYWYHFHKNDTRIDETAATETSLAGYFLELLHQKPPSDLQRDTINIALILYAEHEFNASTFAARVTAATLSDFYSSMCSAIGTLRGPLHGGANEEALKLILEFSSTEEALTGIQNKLKNRGLIMGFGHRVYTSCDPRSGIIKQQAKKLALATGNENIFNISETIENEMMQQKKLFPNLDFYSASAFHLCDIPMDLFTPIFVIARTTGWAAHIIEQQENNKLIRPISEYTGPEPQTFIPLTARNQLDEQPAS